MSLLIVMLLAAITMNGNASGGAYTPPSQMSTYSSACDSVVNNRVDNVPPNNNPSTNLFVASARPSRERGVQH